MSTTKRAKSISGNTCDCRVERRRIGPMIHENPADDVLRRTNWIRLIDPRVPGWERNVIGPAFMDVQWSIVHEDGSHEPSGPPDDPFEEFDFSSVDIPVDSMNQGEVEEWFKRIHAARQ